MVPMTDDMFAMPIDEIRPGSTVPFPLFIYFPVSDRYVIASIPHAFFDESAIERIGSRLKSVWVPQKYKAEYQKYLKSGDAPLPAPKPLTLPRVSPREVAREAEEIAEADALAKEFRAAAVDENLSNTEKQRLFSDLSRQALDSLVCIDSVDPEEKRRGLRKCGQIAYEIILLASVSSNLHKEILQIRSFRGDLDHSVVVSAIAAMFAMGIGVLENEDLQAITLAAFLHDIGMARVPLPLQEKAYSDLSDSEFAQMAEHVDGAVKVLAESGLELSETILDAIRQHHERFDGSGYPLGLSGEMLSDHAQIVAAADWWDELTCGKIDGVKHSPLEAFEIVLGEPGPRESRRLNPELVEEFRRIFDPHNV